MNPRRLKEGSQGLGELIRHTLQRAFPGVEFSVVPLDQTEFGVHWKYKAPGAPGEKEVREHLAERWPSIDAKLRDSDVQSVTGRTGTIANTASKPTPALATSILKSLMPPKKSPLGKYEERCRYCREVKKRFSPCWNCSRGAQPGKHARWQKG
jgi:hypothetical protein